MFFPWLSLAIKTGQLAIESQSVIARRMVRIAGGGSDAQSEIQTMFSEKAAALADAQIALARGLLWNADHAVTAQRVLTVYRKRVRANNRRLSRP
jgi:hypothetical protein